jgi:hypothetical protein
MFIEAKFAGMRFLPVSGCAKQANDVIEFI